MTQHRPDLLPLAGYVTLGLPYHGLVKNGNAQADPPVAGTLHLPSGATRTYTQPYDGGCIMVQHPKHAALTRNSTEQAYDTAQDHQWLEYALLSGRLHQIAGQDLGQNYHLYCDANYTWKIRTALSGGTGSCTLRIYLNGLFGMISDTSYAMTERLLATYTWTPETTSGNPLGGTVGNRYLATYSKTGAKMILNVGTTAITSGVGPTIYTQHNTAFQMHDAIRVTISGDGSLVAGSIGSGISATIEHVIWGDDIYSTSFTSDGGLTDDYSWYRTETTYKYHYATDSDGNETHIETNSISFSEFFRIDPYNPSNPQGSDFDVICSVTKTIAFGGTTLTSLSTYEGYFTYGCPGGTCNVGTVTVNGSAAAWDDSDETADNNPQCPLSTEQGEFTVETPLPLVAIVVNENLPTRLLTAAGGNQIWAEDANQYYTYNPVTGSVQVNGANRICFI